MIIIIITKEHLLVDKMVMRNCKSRKTNLAMAWIDYKKAYDMVPHSWILETRTSHPATCGGKHKELTYDSDVKWADHR